MALAYVKDSRFVLLTCLLQGLGVWCYLLPEPLSTASCSPECASAIKEAAQCQMRSLGFPCIHPNQIHEKVMDTFTKPEVFRQESKSKFESVVSEPSTSTSSLIYKRVSEKCVLLCKRSIRRMFEIPMDVGLCWYPVWTSSPVPFK